MDIVVVATVVVAVYQFRQGANYDMYPQWGMQKERAGLALLLVIVWSAKTSSYHKFKKIKLVRFRGGLGQ